MLWELRAEPMPGSADSVLVEMRQVPGYLDFLAEIMPADVRLCHETTTGVCVSLYSAQPEPGRDDFCGCDVCAVSYIAFCETRWLSLFFFRLAGVFGKHVSVCLSVGHRRIDYFLLVYRLRYTRVHHDSPSPLFSGGGPGKNPLSVYNRSALRERGT